MFGNNLSSYRYTFFKLQRAIILQVMLMAFFCSVAFANEVIKYNFSERSSGVIADLSGNGLDGNLSGSLEIVTAEGNRKLLQGDGTAGAIAIANSADVHIAKGGTICATIKLNNFSDEGLSPETFDMFAYKAQEFIFGRRDKRLYFNMYDGTDWIGWLCTDENLGLKIDTWYHVAVTTRSHIDSATGGWVIIATLYLNGEEVASRSITPSILNYSTSTIEMASGCGSNMWCLDGRMAGITVYDRTLEQEEIEELALAEPFSYRETVKYDFSEYASGAVIDLTEHGHDGTVSGNAEIISGEGARQMLSGDGTSGRVTMANSTAIRVDQEATITAVVKLENLSDEGNTPENYDMFVYKHNEFLFGRREARFYFNMHDDTVWLGGLCTPTELDLQPDTWYHVAVTTKLCEADGNDWIAATIYVDGVAVATTNFSQTEIAQTTNPVELGCGFESSMWYLNGNMAGVTIYDHALTAEEIENLAEAEPLSSDATVEYDFTEQSEDLIADLCGHDHNGAVTGNAEVVEGDLGKQVLRCDGTTGTVTVANSEALHVAKGGTICTVVKLAEIGETSNTPEKYDMFAFKTDEFLFGRMGANFYFNSCKGDAWVGTLTTGDNLELLADTWYHVAVTTDYHDGSYGEKWITQTIYVNGLPAATRKNMTTEINENTEPIRLNYGWGNSVWCIDGDMAHLSIYERALSAEEIRKLVKAEPLVNPLFEEEAVVSETASDTVTSMDNTVAGIEDEQIKVVAAGIAGALRNLADLEWEGYANVDWPALEDFFEDAIENGSSVDGLLDNWNEHDEFLTLDSDETCLTIWNNLTEDKFYLLGLYDKKTNRELLKGRQKIWQLKFIDGNDQRLAVASHSPGVEAEIADLAGSKEAGWSLPVSWSYTGTGTNPLSFEVETTFYYKDDCLSYTISVDNDALSVFLDKVDFPLLSFAQLTDGTDCLLTPNTCGVENKSPITNMINYSKPYPSGSAPLQMGAYYDSSTGIYFATEDPKAQSKSISFEASRGRINVSYSWWVGNNGSGGNDFSCDADSVVRVFRGDWYDAGLLYRNWLSSSNAPWWVNKEQPEWFKENVFWLSISATPSELVDLENNAADVQEIIDLPIAVHWYEWNNVFNNDFPRFVAPAEVLTTVNNLNNSNVYVVPYTNARLWDMDIKDEYTDYDYDLIGSNYAAKNKDGDVYIESYTAKENGEAIGTHQFAVMCPESAGWQQTVNEFTTRLVNNGFDGIYLDQLACSPPVRCYDTSHSHSAGGGGTLGNGLWYYNGARPMLADIRNSIGNDTFLNSEDNAEPYLSGIDGFLGWRWMTMGEVPLFHLIYGGKAQFVGRHTGVVPDTCYNILARQLVNGEQLGWCGPSLLLNTGNEYKASYIRDLCHVRKGICQAFNYGMMDRKANFSEPVTVRNLLWGSWGTRYVDSPDVENSVWQINGLSAMLFVNTRSATGEYTVDIDTAARGLPSGAVKIHKFSASGEECEQRSGVFSEPLTIAPRDTQIWIIEPAAPEEPLSSGPILKYDFYEQSDGVLADLSGNNHYGTMSGSTDVISAEGTRRLLSCDGGTGRVTVNDSSAIRVDQGATICAVIKLESFSDEGNTAENYDMFVHKNSEYFFGRRDTRLYFNMKDANGWLGGLYSPATLNLQADTWYHVAVTTELCEDNGNEWIAATLYVNGEAVATTSFSQTEINQTDNPVELGCAFESSVWYLDGNMADTRVYDRTLEQSEIKALAETENYTCNAKVKYDFSEQSEGVLADLSGNGHDGTLTGSVQIIPGEGGRHLLSCDGSSGRVTLDDSTAIRVDQGATICAVVKLESFSDEGSTAENYDMFVHKYNEYFFGRRDTRLYFNMKDANGWLGGLYSPGTLDLQADTWYHVAVTTELCEENGTDWIAATIYVNGEAVATTNFSQTAINQTTNPVELGCAFESSMWYLDGTMDGVSIYDSALEPEKIKELAQAESMIYRDIVKYDFSTNNSGEVIDLSGKGHSGTVTGNVEITVETDGKRILTGDGTSGRVSMADSTSLHIEKGATISALVKVASFIDEGNTPENYDMFVYKHNEFLLGRRENRFYFNMRDDTGWLPGLVTPDEMNLQPDTWYHLSVTTEYCEEDGNEWIQATIYVDGEAVATRSFTRTDINQTTNPVELACGFESSMWYLDGSIAEVSIYNHPLKPAEIETIANENRTGNQFIQAVKNAFVRISELRNSQ